MAPLTEPARVGAAQAATTEGVRFLSMAPGFPLRAPSELEVILDGLDVEGRALEPLNLLGLADYLESIEATRRVIASTAEPYPVLKRLVEAIASFGSEIAAVRRKIEPSGEVADHASPALASIRERLRRQKSKLRSTLEGFLRERETSKYLQEQVVTDRNGRYVLMVRAEHRGSIPGIVHGSSASGAEPVPGAARHRGDQQRHRRARRAGGRRGVPHPAGADDCVPRPARRPRAHARHGRRARHHPGPRPLLADHRRHRAARRARRRVRAARGAPSAADVGGARARGRGRRGTGDADARRARRRWTS